MEHADGRTQTRTVVSATCDSCDSSLASNQQFISRSSSSSSGSGTASSPHLRDATSMLLVAMPPTLRYGDRVIVVQDSGILRKYSEGFGFARSQFNVLGQE